MFIYIRFIIIIGGILVLFIYITRLASNEIFSPSNKIHREVGLTKELSAPLYASQSGGKLDYKSHYNGMYEQFTNPIMG